MTTDQWPQGQANPREGELEILRYTMNVQLSSSPISEKHRLRLPEFLVFKQQPDMWFFMGNVISF